MTLWVEHIRIHSAVLIKVDVIVRIHTIIRIHVMSRICEIIRMCVDVIQTRVIMRALIVDKIRVVEFHIEIWVAKELMIRDVFVAASQKELEPLLDTKSGID